MKKAAVIMGSDSDLKVVGDAVKQLRELGVPTEARVISAHRTPGAAAEFAGSASENGFGVLIAAAGLAAHLAGALAANTILPVIGIPVASGSLGGLDALLSTAQMPPGVPVAAVGIDAARNAALLAARILALADEGLAEKLEALRRDMEMSVIEKDRRLAERMGGL
ncbi:MAG: 5-(carboxyamino)imidazole ribonucleotide mutase [Oscillospiraceae bacterium]|jgi:5-(carboxyamino)imidazole ribonucleotide mutase|nr:5-(carboxyamino)imidazole ribonucleotide mutase [Oscillospiraceae bacterium]